MSELLHRARTFADWWARYWSIDEWETSKTLQVAAWILLAGWYLAFSMWYKFSDFTVNAVEEGRQLCWPFFQQCGDWYFLSQYPHANTHGLAYALLFGLLVLAAYFLIERRYVAAHLIFTMFFAWEFLVLLMSMRLAINYWFFHILYASLFLFASSKRSFLNVAAVLLYVFSGILKLDPSWTHGAYFKALSEGLYFIPDALIPIATNAVILLEIVLVWFLFSEDRRIRRAVLALLVTFHMYSVIYVGYTYPTVALPIVLVIFGLEGYVQLSLRDMAKSKAGIAIISFFVIISLVPALISGNSRATGEGNKFGMYMFEANYQCRENMTLHFNDGNTRVERSETHEANRRCDPYAFWFYAKQTFCREPQVERVSWTHDASLNGSPLLRIVDVDDLCSLSYSAFTHNTWIRRPGIDAVDAVGTVVPNRYPTPVN